MEAQTVEAIVRDYLDAVEKRDLDRCLRFYKDDACIHFMEGVYQGLEQIETWHRERFDANFRIRDIERTELSGDTLSVDAVITSDRLAAWRLESLSGTATIRIDGDKIKEMSFGMRVYNPLEEW